MNTLSKTRKEAKIKGDKFYFTDKPCKHGHIAKRNTVSGHCIICASNRNRTLENAGRYQLNREKILNTKKENRIKNPEKYNDRQRGHRAKNPEKEKEKNRNYYLNNSNKRKMSSKKWRARNPHCINAFAAKRRAAKLKRTPVWLSESDKREIELIYKIAARVSKETGIDYHVDHEIPLQGEFVSGLHIPDNLQLLKASENLSKGNRFAIN